MRLEISFSWRRLNSDRSQAEGEGEKEGEEEE